MYDELKLEIKRLGLAVMETKAGRNSLRQLVRIIVVLVKSV